MTANPLPIISVHHTLDPTQSVPTAVNATLTFNSVAGTTWYYNTSSFIPGDVQQIALQANAASLSTGRYSYSVQVVDQRSTNTTSPTPAPRRCSTSQPAPSATAGRSQGLEQVIPATDNSGVILSLGDNGESLWFAGNPGGRRQLYHPGRRLLDADQNEHAATRRTLTDGTQITFDSSGNRPPRSTSTTITRHIPITARIN